MKKVVDRPVFVLFEGMDGCGKTCISKMIKKRLAHAHRISTPGDYFSPLRKVVDKEFTGNGTATQLFYILSNVHASNQVRTKLSNGFSVVMDRYVPSTLAYDKTVRCSGFTDEFWIENFLDQIVVPHVTILLHAGPEIRKYRINQRKHGGSTDRASIKHHIELEKRYDQVLSLLGSRPENPWRIERVCNEKTKEECVEECVDLITSLSDYR